MTQEINDPKYKAAIAAATASAPTAAKVKAAAEKIKAACKEINGTIGNYDPESIAIYNTLACTFPNPNLRPAASAASAAKK